MGLTQTKLHHRVMQENWPAICRRLQTEDGKRWVRTKNPCGDYPLHLACYGGHAPPIIIRALIAAYPDAIHLANNMGYKPLELARSNYRDGHPFREEVLEYLEAYAAQDETRDDDNTNDKEDDADGSIQEQLIISIANDGDMPDITFITSTTCVVCLERKADHVVVPCGHMCLCGDCAKKIIGTHPSNHKSLCPVGRCAFTSIAKVQNQPVVQNQCVVVT
mmetsp:Transcript_20983/g.52051  ORF Transcript_20983/g.52051 Transcript_20983/m.52051 type:complete len:220 (-) Transcript_20983:182-841(-)|eukprot:CAMPEP_0116097846 /NCGR_PEP_ID=MMETSP0327-20121206/10918_1 /TAXON_ID=44447 /ORGANISM="Pseudo-nitzschia delicatissima, Strain B596" /LENGTH=219 /DNA_ID=CAMNT_0003589615 /DNA_START=87 /DNA_END=746 /DNA_ORIENTATION=-